MCVEIRIVGGVGPTYREASDSVDVPGARSPVGEWTDAGVTNGLGEA
jgi:hypothetical protein